MVDALILFSFLFVAFWIAIKWADSKIKQSRKRVSEDTPDIDRELALNAEMRRLQGIHRIGDDATERFTTLDYAGKGRDVTRGK